MKQPDAKYFRQKFEEYQVKAREASDPRVRMALEAVAREYLRRANELDSTADIKNGQT